MFEFVAKTKVLRQISLYLYFLILFTNSLYLNHLKWISLPEIFVICYSSNYNFLLFDAIYLYSFNVLRYRIFSFLGLTSWVTFNGKQ